MSRPAARAAVAAAAAAALAATASAQTAALTGVVRSAETGAAVSSAVVVVRGTPLSVLTDAQGRFAIPSLAAGRCTLVVSAIGYATDSVTAVAGDAPPPPVEIVLRPVAVQLSEMVVTAGRGAERADEAVASVAVQSAREIIARNVASVDQALRYVPGVTFNGDEQLDIRGSAGIARGVGSRVLLMLDGHPILTGDGAELDFSTLPLLDIDRTEVVKGAYSAVYGSNALGGVVNVLTTPVEDRPHTALRLSAGAYDPQAEYRWSDGQLRGVALGVQHSRRIGAVGSRAYLGYEQDDGFSENGESRRWVGRVKVGSPPGSARPWDVYGVYLQERAGEAFVWRSADEPYRVPDAAAGNHTVGYKLLTGASVTALARSAALVRVRPYVNVNSLENHFQDNTDWHTAVRPGLTAELAWYPKAAHALTVGVDGAHTWVTSNYIGSPTIRDAAVFAQDEIALAGRWKGSLGLRLDYHHADGASAEWSLSPKIGAAWRPTAAATVRASVGAGYRAPSAIEQFVSSQQFGFRVIPNPELTGEYAWSGELGTSLRVHERVRLDASAFGSLYRDLIGPAPAPDSAFVFQFQNVSRARVAGLDVGLAAEVVPDVIGIEGTYLLLDTEDRDTDEPLPYRSRHNVTATVNLLRGLAAIDVRYRSRVENVLVYPLDPRDDVTLVDVRLAYRIWNVVWQARLANAFNQFYVDVQERNPGAPRSLTLTAVYGL